MFLRHCIFFVWDLLWLIVLLLFLGWGVGWGVGFFELFYLIDASFSGFWSGIGLVLFLTMAACSLL